MRLDVPEWTTIEPGAVPLSLAAFVALTRYKLSMVWVLVSGVPPAPRIGGFDYA